MKHKLPCYLVQDILPNYIEHLVSEKSESAIKEHIEECENCAKVYHAMSSQDIKNDIEIESDKKEIDFLKKTRKKSRKKVWISICAVTLIFVCVLGYLYFFKSNFIYVDDVKVYVEGNNKVSLSGNCKFGSGFKDIRVREEQGGLLEIDFTGSLKSGIYPEKFNTTYEAKHPIEGIIIGTQYIWKDGVNISPQTDTLQKTHNLYVGDVSRNNKIAEALELKEFFGDYKNELQTEKAPYGWSIITQQDFSDYIDEKLEDRLTVYGSAMIAETENLSYVTFEYMKNGWMHTYTVDQKMASDCAGEDIKKLGENIDLLEHFVDQSGLKALIRVEQEEYIVHANVQRKISITLSSNLDNMTQAEISYSFGNLIGKTVELKAVKGEENILGKTVTCEITDSDLWNSLGTLEECSVSAHMKTIDGFDARIDNVIPINAAKQGEYQLVLDRDRAGNYIVKAK